MLLGGGGQGGSRVLPLADRVTRWQEVTAATLSQSRCRRGSPVSSAGALYSLRCLATRGLCRFDKRATRCALRWFPRVAPLEGRAAGRGVAVGG